MFDAPTRGNPLEFLDETYPAKTSGIMDTDGEKFHNPNFNRFYRAMHFSAKRGITIACRLSVCDVGELWSHRLEFFENNFTISKPGMFALCNPNMTGLLQGEHP